MKGRIRNKIESVAEAGAILVAVLLALSTSSLGQSVWIRVEANPSQNCFPASALEEVDLVEAFKKACTECTVNADEHRQVDFRIVVEDPYLGWVLRIYDRNNVQVKTLEWKGSLASGLQKAVTYMIEHKSGERIQGPSTLVQGRGAEPGGAS